MKIYKPIRNTILTQTFGLEGTATHLLDEYKELNMIAHNGFDWAAPKGTSIYFDVWSRGKVYKQFPESGGLDIITHEKDGKVYKHRYWHLDQFACEIGQEVETGDLIGYVGNKVGSKGFSTGPHLHRGLKPVCQTAEGEYRNLLSGNGYHGAVDIKPFYKNVFVKDEMERLEAKVEELLIKKKSWIEKIIEAILQLLRGLKR